MRPLRVPTAVAWALGLGAAFGSSACSDAAPPQAAVRYSEATRVPLPYESGSFVLDLWLEGQQKLQIASAGTGQVDVDIEFEDGDRQDLQTWTLVGEVQVRPIHLPGQGSRPARLHFEASPLVRWQRARLLTPVPPPATPTPHGLAGCLAGRTVVFVALPDETAATSASTELAARGVRFDHCYSQSAWWLPRVATLFTGLEQELHGVIDAGRTLAPELATLPERFQRAGYRTVALVRADELDESSGIRRGFDEWSPFQTGTTESELMLRAAEREFDEAPDAPRFVYVHFDADSAAAGLGHLWEHAISIGADEFVFVLAPLRATSDGGLRATTSLVISAPGSPLARGRTVEELVSTVDVAPTLTELMDLEPLRPTPRARSLAPLLRSGLAPTWPARHLYLSEDYRQASRRTAIVFGGYKYIRTETPDGPRDELFDLERDPDERHDLAAHLAVRTGALRNLLTNWWDQTPIAGTLAPVTGVGVRVDASTDE